MNRDRIEEHWKQAGDRNEQWEKPDRPEVIAGRHDKLLGALQANYGLARDGAAPRNQGDSDNIRRIARENADLIGR